MKTPVTFCADVGSIVQGNFAWCRKDGSKRNRGKKIQDLVTSVARDLKDNRAVALGFECPLFVPLPNEPGHLGRARKGEKSRPWSAGAGTFALSTGLVQAAWILREVRKSVGSGHRAFLDWREFRRAGKGLLLWEAFVSGSAKRKSHVEDARAGISAFTRGTHLGLNRATAENSPVSAIFVREAEAAYSLIGAAMLYGGWSRDIALLRQPCLVFKA